MSLPKIDTPLFEMDLISQRGPVTYRPFLVKEEKVMLVALESDDDNAIQEAVIQIISNCIVTPGVKVNALSIFDFEYLFLQVRSKSVGEVVNLKLKCPDDEKVLVDHALHIDELEVKFPEEHKLEIPFTKDYGVIMKYPTIKSFRKDVNPAVMSFELFKDCIQTIYKGDETYDKGNIEAKELDEWIDTLTPEYYNKVLAWFKTMPKIEHVVDYKNPKSGKEFKLRLQGIKDFF